MRIFKIFELIINEIDAYRIQNCKSCNSDNNSIIHTCVTDIFSRTCFDLSISNLYYHDLITYDEFLMIQKLNNDTKTN